MYTKIWYMRKHIFLVLFFIGFLLRSFLQFFNPSFNVDEISLGNNIKNSNFIELLHPLKYGQSSPPLYLWIQKIIITISPLDFWINIKILSFISSVIGIALFYVFVKKNNYNLVFLLVYGILLFNPFIVYNSLTVKQYTIDLTGVIFLLVYFKSNWFYRYNWFFFLFWGLMSNIGLFACAGFLLYNFIDSNSYVSIKSGLLYLKKSIYTLLAPLPYIFYFIWYMEQKGASEMRLFMVRYWNDSFIPLDGTIFKYMLYTIHGLWIFLFNSFEIWGFFLLFLTILFFVFSREKESLFKQEMALLLYTLLIHLILNIFHLYPFSDRLYLYLAPLFILTLGSSLTSILSLEHIKKYFYPINFLICFFTFFLYFLYTPFSDNDIFGLYKKTNNLQSNKIYLTQKAMNCVENFNEFTDNKFENKKSFILVDSKLERAKYLVSRVSKKIKKDSTSPEEVIVQNLIELNKLTKIDVVNGYNIYSINN